MRRVTCLFALCACLLAARPMVWAQARYAVSYAGLVPYQGIYEYSGGQRLRIAASPVDTTLYAFIGEARYALRAAGPDLFLNAGGQEVRFARDAAGIVSGYSVGGQAFHLLDRNVSFPPQLWYARVENGKRVLTGRYVPPPDLKDGLRTGTLKGTGLDSLRLDSLRTQILSGAYADVHSVLIIKDGKLVCEEYFYDTTRDTLHPLRSATKSFISALTGIAIERKFFKDVNQHIVPYFGEYALRNYSEDKQKIRIKDLLDNQSGLACDITDNASPGNETVMGRSADWVEFTLDLPMAHPPGTYGAYCSGNPIVAGRLVEKVVQKPLPDFAREVLFSPLGITQYKWNFKPDSTSAETFCQLYLRPRDMAKFGLLYLNKGRWQGKPVVPARWVTESLRKHSTVQGVDYGYLWWIKHLDAGESRFYGMAAQGNGGQRIFIWPELNMVTVVTGGNYNRQSPADEIIARYILASFKKR